MASSSHYSNAVCMAESSKFLIGKRKSLRSTNIPGIWICMFWNLYSFLVFLGFRKTDSPGNRFNLKKKTKANYIKEMKFYNKKKVWNWIRKSCLVFSFAHFVRFQEKKKIQNETCAKRMYQKKKFLVRVEFFLFFFRA